MSELKRKGMLELLHRIRTDDELRDDFRNALLVLSFDACKKLWPEMGLVFRKPDLVLDALRRYGDPEADTHMVCLGDYTAEDDVWLAWRLFGEIALDEGEDAVYAIWNWYQVSAQVAPAWQWIWAILLTCLAVEEESALVRLGLPRGKARKVLALAKRWTRASDDLDTRMEVMWPETPDFASWDGSKIFDLDHLEYDYRTLVLEALKRPAFGRAWQAVADALTPLEMKALMGWGKERYLRLIADIDAGELDEPMPTVAEAMVPTEMRTRN